MGEGKLWGARLRRTKGLRGVRVNEMKRMGSK